MYNLIGKIPFWFGSDDNAVSLYSSVRISRNFKSINFPTSAEFNSFKEVEKKVDNILEGYILCGAIVKRDLSHIDQSEILWLQKFRILPDKRNDMLSKMRLYYNKEFKSFLLTNYIDHLTFFSHECGRSIKKAYNNCISFEGLFDKADLSKDNSGNYHTSKLDYFGSGVKCFSVLTLPAPRLNGEFSEIIGSLENNMLSKKDYFSLSEQDLILITNKDSFSKKQKDIVSDFNKLLDELEKISKQNMVLNEVKIVELRQKCQRIINYDFLTFKNFIEIYHILSLLRINKLSNIRISELNEQLGFLIIDSPKTILSGGMLKKSVIGDFIEKVNGMLNKEE
ncbi:MAG: hypothetical protein KKD38_03095 [Candidatus Delongbacteria bacterium]|nr:hypothetical protein [Candidatus Delongbacteria bacterium]MCG2759869.1 hypothetical protein [Candidatus Delongbacteria bacterium]